MELIIKIPDEQYNDIVKHLTDNDGNYAYSDFNLREIIRNGTPYNPTGDLISREALKGVIETYRPALIYDNITDMKNRMVDYFLDEIDNAPSVTPRDNYDLGYVQGLEDGRNERPQGKWGKWIVAEIQCPTCFKYYEVDYYSAEELNKCPSCGADMRKGGAE